jgi:hypothetical protein
MIFHLNLLVNMNCKLWLQSKFSHQFNDDMVLQQQRTRTPSKQVNTDDKDMNNGSSGMDNGLVSSVVAFTVHHGVDAHNNEHGDNVGLQPNSTNTLLTYIDFTPHDDPAIYVEMGQFQLSDNIKSSWVNKQPANINAIREYMKLQHRKILITKRHKFQYKVRLIQHLNINQSV